MKWIPKIILILAAVRFGNYIIETDIIRSSHGRASPLWCLWLERIIASIFTVEFFYKLIKAEDKKKYLMTSEGVINLLSILPFWIGFICPESWLSIIRGLRTFSLLKFYQKNTKVRAIVYEIYNLRKVIGQVLLINTIMIFLFGAVMYEAEHIAQPDKFGRVIDGIWFSGVTASTTGFGDLFPVTLTGRISAALLMLVGISFVSIYIGVITTAATRAFKHELADVEK